MRKHIPTLDGVRGIAVLLVLGHNFDLLEGLKSAPALAFNLVINSGWLGVQLFFVLSGLLITGILLDTRKAENYWSSFLTRRALRIFPLYYAVLIASFVIAPLIGHPLPGSNRQIWLWTYLANFVPPVSIFPHFWSLSVEEHFYFVWPLVVRRLAPRRLALVCAVLVVVALVSRIVLRATSFGPDAAYAFTFARLDGLAMGAAGAIALRDEGARSWLVAGLPKLRWVAVALALVTLVSTRAARTGVQMQTYGYTVFGVVFAVFVLDAVLTPPGGPFARVLTWSPLRAVGKYSYGMYILHVPLHLLVGERLLARVADIPVGSGTTSVPIAAAYVVGMTAATYLVALVSYHLLEKHFLGLKRRVEPRLDERSELPQDGAR